MKINILQGNDKIIKSRADINIIIDVIRAFTVSHMAFINGAEKIILVNDVQEAFKLKKENNQILLAGEIKGLLIDGFDLDNSPLAIFDLNLQGKTIVQKTTNGVKAALNSLNAERIIVTGLTNAENTVKYVNNYIEENTIADPTINIVASHPTSDEDIACAEYIYSLLVGENNITLERVVQRVLNAENAKKFRDKNDLAFSEKDLEVCTAKIKSDFVMIVNKHGNIPTIERFTI